MDDLLKDFEWEIEAVDLFWRDDVMESLREEAWTRYFMEASKLKDNFFQFFMYVVGIVTLESLHWGNSNEYPRYRFLWRIMKNYP